MTIRRFILEPSFVNYEYFNRKLTQRLLQRKNSFQKKKRRKKEAINSVCLIVFHKLCHSFYKEISVRVWKHARLIGLIIKNHCGLSSKRIIFIVRIVISPASRRKVCKNPMYTRAYIYMYTYTISVHPDRLQIL